jgi:hypothetical protein
LHKCGHKAKEKTGKGGEREKGGKEKMVIKSITLVVMVINMKKRDVVGNNTMYG